MSNNKMLDMAVQALSNAESISVNDVQLDFDGDTAHVTVDVEVDLGGDGA